MRNASLSESTGLPASLANLLLLRLSIKYSARSETCFEWNLVVVVV